jgi:molybdate transport system substrate-binding protein
VLTVLAIVVALVGCRQPAAPNATAMNPNPAKAAATPAAGEQKISLYVPCGMIIPVRAVMDAFEVQNPGVKVKGKFENSGIIVDLLTKKGEKADLVMTPGNAEMDRLKAGGVVTAEPKRLGDFELVVIVPAKGKLDLKSPADLAKCKTISCPNPDINSTGLSGREALTKLGLWDALKPKMVFTTHAIESHTMVAGGKSDAGIAYRNCPLDTNPEKLSKSKVHIAFGFPADSYRKQPCLIAKTKDANELADKFLDFISSTEGLKLLADKGMTGCLEMAQGVKASGQAEAGAKGSAGGAAAGAKPVVTVSAFYPDNAGHAKIKALVLGLNAKHGGKVKAEFTDFTSDEGFKKWQAAGMTCGGILINNEQTWTYTKNGKPTEVTFKMAIGGEWTAADLDAVVKKALAEKSKPK